MAVESDDFRSTLPGLDSNLFTFVEKWNGQAEAWTRLKAQVSGSEVCRDVLEDLRAIGSDLAGVTLNLTEAAELSGYTPDHLSRMVRAGQLPNHGEPHRPRIPLMSLPAKAKGERDSVLGSKLSPTEIARAVVTQKQGNSR